MSDDGTHGPLQNSCRCDEPEPGAVIVDSSCPVPKERDLKGRKIPFRLFKVADWYGIILIASLILSRVSLPYSDLIRQSSDELKKG
jgi:hypothetical protein